MFRTGYAELMEKYDVTFPPEGRETFTYDEAVELYALAKENGVVLMEGIRAAYLPGFQLRRSSGILFPFRSLLRRKPESVLSFQSEWFFHQAC